MATAFFEKTDEQQAIVEMVRQFADEQILPQAEHYSYAVDEFPEPIVAQMRELGLFGVTIPEGVRRHGPRSHHLRHDRRGALARLDLDLRHRRCDLFRFRAAPMPES